MVVQWSNIVLYYKITDNGASQKCLWKNLEPWKVGIFIVQSQNIRSTRIGVIIINTIIIMKVPKPF